MGRRRHQRRIELSPRHSPLRGGAVSRQVQPIHGGAHADDEAGVGANDVMGVDANDTVGAGADEVDAAAASADMVVDSDSVNANEESFNANYLGPLARRRGEQAAVPRRVHELVVLARTTFPQEKVDLLADRRKHGEVGENAMTPMQRYRLGNLYKSYKWRTRLLRRNRFLPRIVRAGDDADDADDDAAGHEVAGEDVNGDATNDAVDLGAASAGAGSANGDGGAAAVLASSKASTVDEANKAFDSNSSSSSSSSSARSSSSSSSTHSDDDEDNDDGGKSIRGAVVLESTQAKLAGRAADGSSDAEMERVLFVQASSRSADALDAKGQRLGRRTWYEVVPQERVVTVLQSLWHVGGIQSLSAAKLYARVRELYVGISLMAVAAFVRRQEAAQLARSNVTSDKILAPRLPQAVNDVWYSDHTFLSADIPVAAPPGGKRYIGFLSILDSLSRFVWTVPVRDKSAATIAAAHEGVILAVGAPRALVQDNAQENSGYTMGKLAQRYNFALRFTKPHVSQENAAERVHQTLKNLLRTAALELQPAAAKGKQLLLPPLLARVTQQYNCTMNATIKMTPFHVFFGRAPPPSGPPQLVDQDVAADDADDDADDDANGAAGEDAQGAANGVAGKDGVDTGGSGNDGENDEVDDDEARARRLAHRPVARRELRDIQDTGLARPAPGRRQPRVAPAGAPQYLAGDFELDDRHAQVAAARADEVARAHAARESGAMQIARARERLGGLVVSAASIIAIAPVAASDFRSAAGVRSNGERYSRVRVRFGASSAASSASTAEAQTVNRITGVVWDRRFERILYLVHYGARRVVREDFSPASDFGLTDEQLQMQIVRKRWTVAFIGGLAGPGYMGSADRRIGDVVEVADVVDEVERGDVYNDGQDPRGSDVDNDDGFGVELVEPSATAAPAASRQGRSVSEATTRRSDDSIRATPAQARVPAAATKRQRLLP